MADVWLTGNIDSDSDKAPLVAAVGLLKTEVTFCLLSWQVKGHR